MSYSHCSPVYFAKYIPVLFFLTPLSISSLSAQIVNSLSVIHSTLTNSPFPTVKFLTSVHSQTQYYLFPPTVSYHLQFGYSICCKSLILYTYYLNTYLQNVPWILSVFSNWKLTSNSRNCLSRVYHEPIFFVTAAPRYSVF